MHPKFRNFVGYPLFLQMLYKIISNAHVSIDPLGVGVYPLLSQCNHSCDSNCCYWVEEGRIVLAAEKPISPETEITYSYIKEVYQPKALRQKVLCYRNRNWISGGSSAPVCAVPPQGRLHALSSVAAAADLWT